METFDHETQEAKLKALRPYLRQRPIVPDTYGAPMIKGRSGYIYASPDGYQLVCFPDDGRTWASIKKRLSKLADVTQDGDGEGILVFRKRRLTLPESNAIALAIDL